ncbi:uncharacterized protein LOC110829568 [Zootermopsis nevadensis]|uniref:Uncharacterized protein n=1 Tax=Zootermopsis nevadensis TaxID=136037 RepID=A0A067R8E4_ZOONE|nr:uncharacterized protein LOC110829568 [Zootermopsis nevadensis]XP_021919107.1 uncharacterized protein LOC110829568 [Zootermopsis nevadensis]KDR19836.1 hypothetical protein L798_05902 [Zootermopsis nevadensis]
MQLITLCFCAAISALFALTSLADAQQIVLVSDADINAVQQGALSSSEVFGPVLKGRAERQKRKILEPIVEASFGVKSVLLNIIFGKVNQLIDYKTRLVDQLDRKNIELNKAVGLYGEKPCDTPSQTTVKPAGSTTTEEIADVGNRRVNLELPNELIGSSFSLVTRISKIISDVILNTAARTQRLVEAVKPTFGKVLGIKTSTRKPPTGAKSSAISSSYSSSSSTRNGRGNAHVTYLANSHPSVSQNLIELGS